ncbi:hypothetical protein [Streptomyces sp. BBFR115]|uniref:hypothetical protein n=1 Tax=Streptomyces sp. BBFR115 TaxID=3448173 RepID=UPI003F75F9AA
MAPGAGRAVGADRQSGRGGPAGRGTASRTAPGGPERPSRPPRGARRARVVALRGLVAAGVAAVALGFGWLAVQGGAGDDAASSADRASAAKARPGDPAESGAAADGETAGSGAPSGDPTASGAPGGGPAASGAPGGDPTASGAPSGDPTASGAPGGETAGSGSTGGAGATGGAGVFGDPGYLGCARLVVEGEVTRVAPVSGGAEVWVTLRVTHTYKADRPAKEAVVALTGPLGFGVGDHVLVAVPRRADGSDAWLVGERAIAPQRDRIARALPASRATACG